MWLNKCVCVCVWWEWDFCVWICSTYMNNVPLAGRVNSSLYPFCPQVQRKSNFLSYNFAILFLLFITRSPVEKPRMTNCLFFPFILLFFCFFLYIRCVVKPCRRADGHRAWADNPQELQSVRGVLRGETVFALHETLEAKKDIFRIFKYV